MAMYKIVHVNFDQPRQNLLLGQIPKVANGTVDGIILGRDCIFPHSVKSAITNSDSIVLSISGL